MWAIIVLLSVGLFNMFQDPAKINTEKNKLPFSNFLTEVENGRVVEVQIQGNNISGVVSDGKTFNTYSPNYPELVEKLAQNNLRQLVGTSAHRTVCQCGKLPDIHHGSTRHRPHKRSLHLGAAPHEAPCGMNDGVAAQRIRVLSLVHIGLVHL